MRNADLVARDLKAVWHPCTQMKDYETLPLIPIKRGEGVWLEDFEGNRYIDAVSSWWVNLFGHANPRINAAIREQTEQLEHVILAGFTHEPVVRLSERLVSVTPEGLNRCFYADNGSSAIEGALKMSGSGVRRDRAKPAELSLGEQQAVFYNLMCAHSQLGDVDKAIASLEAVLRAGYCSAQLYGFGKANEDYERLMRDGDLETARADPRFKQVVDRYNVEPSELQLQLDPSQSVIGRAMKMWGSKK